MQTYILLLNSTSSSTILGCILAENRDDAALFLKQRLISKGLTEITYNGEEQAVFFRGFTTINMECDECPTTKEYLNENYPSLHATESTHYIFLASPETMQF